MPKEEVSYVKGILQHTVQERQEHHKTISYSQFSMYSTCPKQWELKYPKGLRDFNYSIHLLFGTAFHETLQTYLYEVYEGAGPGAADKMDLHALLREQMTKEYIKAMEEQGGEIFTDQTQMEEFYQDGVNILNYITRHRRKYFSTKGYELVAIEMPILMQASEHNDNVFMYGFVDVILRDKVSGKYIIIDIKTSTMGWNKWQKADKTKTSQLIIYKKYFAKQIGCEEKDIDVKYFIVRRKIPEDSMYPIKPVSEFSPASGKPTVNKVMTDVDSFVKNAFHPDGTHNIDRNYLAIGGKGLKHCKWCPFKDNEELCPKKERIRE
jgi:hypothetical protein